MAIIKMTKTMIPMTIAAIRVFCEWLLVAVTPVGFGPADALWGAFGFLVGAGVVSKEGWGVCPVQVLRSSIRSRPGGHLQEVLAECSERRGALTHR